ncbi:CHASE3 domain-containing protein, partial [bacterium]|nr:CHASE3 domain-containing protein [bacterium]
ARKHTRVLISSAEQLLSKLKDAETGQRGYLLTGDTLLLEPYLAVHDSISGHLEELRQGNSIPAADQYLNALAPIIDAQLSEMAQVIALRRSQNITAAL